MKRLFIAAIVAFGLSSAALAQTQPVPTAIAPGGQTMNSTPTAIMVAPAGGAAGKGTVVSPDHPLPVVGSFTIPTGAATAAKQDTGNTSLGSIDTKLSSQATAAKQDTSNTWLSSIVTNTTGASTAAKQDTGNTSLGSIDTKLSSQATAVKQDTGNTSLGSIDTKLSSQATAAAQATGNASLATIVTNTTGAATAVNQTAPQAVAGSDASKAFAVQGITGGKPVFTAPAFGASGVSAVTGTFAATGQSASLTPISGRSFNVTMTGTFVATVQLERSFDAGATWVPLTAGGVQVYIFTTPVSETAVETETSVRFRLNCKAYTSGTVTYRISQ